MIGNTKHEVVINNYVYLQLLIRPNNKNKHGTLHDINNLLPSVRVAQ